MNLLPNITWIVEHQGPVVWLYVSMIVCLSTRIWLSLRLLLLDRPARQAFLERTFTLSEATGNIALLFGVLGTLIGVSIAVAGQSSTVDSAKLMETFTNAFGIAVATTIAGGLTYVLCYLLSSLDEYVAGDNNDGVDK